MKPALAKSEVVTKTLLPLDELVCSVEPYNPEFYEEVKADVIKNGLHFPVVVIHLSAKEWHKISDGAPLIRDPPNETDNHYFVSCGNNRVKIFRELGYTHIDCAVFGSYGEGSVYCKQMRRWMDGRDDREVRERRRTPPTSGTT